MVLAERFNVSELQGIAYELGVDFETLPGDEKMGKLREMVKWCERARRLDD
ncbi:MAG: hypothetical protein HC853_19210 [Anaerolineae bacterium]|nr:hypothetical protein [Anaerolineae bacterium]